jgi:hypothetical protein
MTGKGFRAGQDPQMVAVPIIIIIIIITHIIFSTSGTRPTCWTWLLAKWDVRPGKF